MEPFCRGCYLHLNDAYEVAAACCRKSCTFRDYDRIYHVFRQLQAEAHSTNHLVIEKYARSLAAFARFLRDHPGDNRPYNQDLILAGIEFGHRCQGRDPAQCPAMHYDELLLLMDNFNRQMLDHGQTRLKI